MLLAGLHSNFGVGHTMIQYIRYPSGLYSFRVSTFPFRRCKRLSVLSRECANSQHRQGLVKFYKWQNFDRGSTDGHCHGEECPCKMPNPFPPLELVQDAMGYAVATRIARIVTKERRCMRKTVVQAIF